MKLRRALLATLCAAACSGLAGYAAARAATPAGLVAVPVDEVLVSADGRTLSASRSGPCLPATALRAREGEQAVTVTLATVPRVGACSGGAESRTWTVTLAAPLGGREVIDSSDGRGVAVFDERELLRPATLPAGYGFVYDAAMYATGNGAAESDWDASCAQLYADGRGDQLWISQSYGKHWPDGWGPAMPSVPVRHALARSRPGMLAWQENGESFLIVSVPVFGEPMPVSALADVAQGLRRAGP